MSKKRRLYAKPYLVLAISVFLSLVAAAFSYWYSSQRTRQAFEQLADDQQAMLSQKIEERVTLVRGFAGLFMADAEVSNEDFSRYALQSGLAVYPDVRSIGYVER